MSSRSGIGKVRIASSGGEFYTEYQATNAYVEKAFGFVASKVTVTNDSEADDDVQLSWDGATLITDLKMGESKEFRPSDRSSIYVKATAGGENVRIWAE